MRIAWPYSFKVSTLRSILIKQIKAKYVYTYMIIFVNINIKYKTERFESMYLW